MKPQIAHRSGIAQSLFAAFVQPALVRSSTSFAYTPKGAPSTQTLPHKLVRSFSVSAHRLTKTRAPEERTQKWDEEITGKLGTCTPMPWFTTNVAIARVIYLVNLQTNKLSEPVTRFDALRSYDRKTHRLVQVSPDEPNKPEFKPVCKIISKKEQYAADKLRKETQKESVKVAKVERSIKTLELNWAIDPNDLGHRLNRMEEFLSEGRKVEVVFAAKKRGRQATEKECEALLQRIRDTVDAVPGAKETKSLEGKLGSFAQLLVEGRAPKTA